jgi:hypothetical protein
MAELSPQAQAVLDAYADVATRKILTERYVEKAIAAALRAVALYCRDRRILLTIADELENN